MTLSPPLVVGFAVAGGVPTNAGDWVTVDLDAYVEHRSRGIVVATEPVEHDGASLEMARVARELIVTELRAMDDLPPDEAIGRAFAAANGMLYDESRTSPTAGYDRKVLVGATAMLLDGHRCTIGHVPPGQIALIEDGLAYTVPELDAWLPGYAQPADSTAPPEPLGFTSWTAPVLARTELSDGDVAMLCSASLAEALAVDLDETGRRVQDLAGYHGRSPDSALDVFRGLLIDGRIEDGTALVVGFPPRPGSFGVVSLDDVTWRLRERRRRVSAQARSLLPVRMRAMVETAPVSASASLPSDAEDPEGITNDFGGDGATVPEGAGAGEAPASGLRRFVPRLHHRDSTGTWNVPTRTQQYGLPRTHGVQIHRRVSTERGEAGWRTALPRLPFGGAIAGVLLVAIVVLLALGLWSLRPEPTENPVAQSSMLSQVDQYILAADDSTDPDDTRRALDLAQTALDIAREEGASPQELAPRQAAITDARDVIEHVIRLDNLARLGTLPEALRGGTTRVQLTGNGLFLVNGGLYRIRTDQRQIIPVLAQGETTGGVKVGDLFGIAMDSTGLHVTDGTHVFTLHSDGDWVPVKLGDINNLGPWDVGPVGAFGGNVYILEPEYRNIYRFNTGETNTAEPHDWALASVRPDLAHAVAMAIDASIYVLLDNPSAPDEVLTYLKGDLEHRHQIPYAGSGTSKAIRIGSGTRLLYVAMQDGDDGWVVVFDPTSGDAWQLRLPAGFSVEDAGVAAPFAGLQDVAIDESTGTLYIVNDDAVWTAQYQLPAEAQGTPTPEAVDDAAA